jgi:hypothetical protein
MSGGVLAIWNDCAPGQESAYENWYQTEHLFERVGLAGFRSGRRFESLSGSPTYLTVYEVDAPSVLLSPAYIERLNNPTPETRRIMTEAFVGMTRAICQRRLVKGRLRGGAAATARLGEGAETDVLMAAAHALWDPSQVAWIELWLAVAGGPGSEEERLRGGDTRISACIYVETLRATEATDIAATLAEQLPGAETGAYQLLCQLDDNGVKAGQV